jgi:hypothetical protein
MKKLVNTVFIFSALIIFPIFLNADEPAPEAEPLSVTCEVDRENAYYDDVVNWTANVSGGTPDYSYNWSGDISGSVASVSESFSAAGIIQASVMVADSVGAMESVDCDTVRIIAPLEYVSCNSIETNSNTGYEVEWEADITGGIKPYTLTWSGSDGLSGSSNRTSITYTTAGEKTGRVSNISSSDGQTIIGDWDCSPIVTVVEQPAEMTVSCEANLSTIVVGSEIIWNTTISGGSEPYTIDLSGTDSLSGSDDSVLITYDTTGSKAASVNVTSSDAQAIIGVSCGSVDVTEVVEEETTSSSRSSSRRRSSSRANDGEEIIATTTEAEDELPLVTSIVSTEVEQATEITPAPLGTVPVTQTEIDSTSIVSTTTAISTDLELASNAGLLAFIGDVNIDWLGDYIWIIISLIILALLSWFIFTHKRRKNNNE